MPRSTYRNPNTSSTLWVGWGVYGGIAFFGFCFGVWAGNQRPATIEIVKAAPTTNEQKKEKEAEPANHTPAPTVNKKNPPVQKKFEPSGQPLKVNEPVAVVEPKKMDTMPAMPTPKETKPEPKEATEPPQPKMVATNLTFDKDIKPILRANCLNCHGDPLKKGEFDIRTLQSVKIGGDSGAGVIPGDSKSSPLWDRIFDNSMPPKDSKKVLTPMEKMMIKEWIEGGAK